MRSRTRGSRARQWLCAEDGNTLMLVPAGFLVVIILAGIAIDAAAGYLGVRRLSDLAASVANDAVGALDHQHFYDTGGEAAIDPLRAQARAEQLIAGIGEDRTLENAACTVVPIEEGAQVTCRARVRPLFAPAIPGARRIYDIEATESAVASRAP